MPNTLTDKGKLPRILVKDPDRAYIIKTEQYKDKMGTRSIRVSILAIVFISLLPVLLLLLYKASEQRKQEVTAIQAESLNSVKFISLGIEHEITESRQMLLRDIILLTLTGLAAGLIAWFGSDFFIMHRMRGLAAATDKLGNGNLGVRVSISSRNDEIDQFAMSFNKMAAALERHMTEGKKAEEAHEKLELQLRHAQKMEVVGQLAGGLAHDFNNIVSAMMGFASICQIEMKEDDPSFKYIANILTLSERAAHLIKSLLTFSRKQAVDLKPINLKYSIKTVLEFIEKIIGNNINLVTNMSDEDLIVVADSGQLEQVLMNLAANARDAMPQGGTISINTGEVEINREFIDVNGFGREGTYALITVADTGIGMDEQTRERVFEPFFTTKEAGKGTGLGLAIVYGIIKQHNGFLKVYSEPCLGATFRIYLPAVKIAAEEKKRRKQQAHEYAKISGPITSSPFAAMSLDRSS